MVIPNTPLLALENVVVGYWRPLFPSLNWVISRGQYWGLIGPNGSGKSTLLKTLLGLIPPLAGTILRSALGDTIHFGYVPQHGDLDRDFPLTVREILELNLRFSPPPAKTFESFRSMLDDLALLPLLDRHFSDLSGGERQKVLIARALIFDSPCLILDEPTNGLDLHAEQEIIAEVRRLHRAGKTIILVTHSLELLLNEADHFALLGESGAEFHPRAAIIEGDIISRVFHHPVGLHTHQGRHFLDHQPNLGHDD